MFANYHIYVITINNLETKNLQHPTLKIEK
jgi:hypothetical protein